MEFKFSDSFYVSETDLDRMAYLCIENGDLPIHKSMSAIAEEWDDADFYIFGLVEDKVAEEVARRIEAIKN